MDIKREKLFRMWDAFQKLSMKKSSVKFHYLVLKNKKLLEPEIEAVKELGKPPEAYQEFDKKRIDMCNEYCTKDETGNPVVSNNNFVIPD